MARDPLTHHSEQELADALNRLDGGTRLTDHALRAELLHLGLARRDAEDDEVVHATPEGRKLARRWRD